MMWVFFLVLFLFILIVESNEEIRQIISNKTRDYINRAEYLKSLTSKTHVEQTSSFVSPNENLIQRAQVNTIQTDSFYFILFLFYFIASFRKHPYLNFVNQQFSLEQAIIADEKSLRDEALELYTIAAELYLKVVKQGEKVLIVFVFLFSYVHR